MRPRWSMGTKQQRKNLTDARIRALEPDPTKRYERYDARVPPPLCVTVQSSGRKAFYLVYSFRGATRWYWLGPAGPGGIDVNEARMRAKLVIALVAAGRDPHAERIAERRE